jgi:hypothetical protein
LEATERDDHAGAEAQSAAYMKRESNAVQHSRVLCIEEMQQEDDQPGIVHERSLSERTEATEQFANIAD